MKKKFLYEQFLNVLVFKQNVCNDKCITYKIILTKKIKNKTFKYICTNIGLRKKNKYKVWLKSSDYNLE